MNNSINKLDLIEFKEEIAHKLELDFNKDIFDLMVEVENIIAEKNQIIEYDDRHNITLNKLDTSNLENIKTIECFYVSIRDNNDYDNYLNIIFDDYNKARQYFDNYISIKTLDDWNKSKYNYFEDFVKPGDKVSQDIVDYFSNSVPPITFKNDFVQAGEPYSHRKDPFDNKIKTTYTTFEEENGIWVYKGNCFRNNNIDTEYIVKEEIFIEQDLEKYKDTKLLLQNNKCIAYMRKQGKEIAIEINGDVVIKDKEGNYIATYDEKFKEDIEKNHLDEYEIVNNNWIEISYYQLAPTGEYVYDYSDSYAYFGIEEIGEDRETIKKFLNEQLDEYIEEKDIENEQ